MNSVFNERRQQQRKRQLILALTTYIISALVIALLTYFIVHRHLITDIDHKLLDAAYATNTIIGSDVHRQNMDENSISNELDFDIAMRLTDLVRQQALEYVYSMIMVGDKVVFVTSSATREEMANNDYVPAYFMDYPGASDTLIQVFKNNELLYDEYTDQWGDFRSVFVPYVANDGILYVIGADISLATLTTTAWQSAGIALLVCIAFGLIGFPLFLLYTRALQQEAEQELQRLYRCPLTNLPNRSQLLEDLETDETIHITIINIDKFREINSLYGPAMGDELLKQFSIRLNNIDPTPLDRYTAYHLYADEFAIFVKGDYPRAIMETKIGELYKHLTHQNYLIANTPVKLRIRIGAAVDGEEAFAMADIAMREAIDKNQTLVLYDNNERLPKAYQRNFELTQLIRNAIEKRLFATYYQPILNTTTGEFDKYECLARLVDEEGNIVSYPNEFLPVAYRSRLYHKFSMQMLENIFSELPKHKQTVSINISISDIKRDRTRQYLFQRLSNRHIAKRVELEILENENIEDLGQIRKFIKIARSLGCKVGLDDLGKDYSNIDRLLALPVDFIKIDGNIILAMASDEDAQNVARTIVSFAYKRNIKTVAEYCCDGKTSDIARRLGVDYLQGFHIGKPHTDLKTFFTSPKPIVDPLLKRNSVG